MRVRLTLLYGGALFLAGAVLIVLMYVCLDRSLDRHAANRAAATEQLTAQFVHDNQNADQLHDALRAQFQQDRDDTLQAMLIWSLISLGVVGHIAGGLGWLLAGRALRPLQRITATARRIADRSLHERIALSGPHDEIKDLADTFDAMPLSGYSAIGISWIRTCGRRLPPSPLTNCTHGSGMPPAPSGTPGIIEQRCSKPPCRSTCTCKTKWTVATYPTTD